MAKSNNNVRIDIDVNYESLKSMQDALLKFQNSIKSNSELSKSVERITDSISKIGGSGRNGKKEKKLKNSLVEAFKEAATEMAKEDEKLSLKMQQIELSRQSKISKIKTKNASLAAKKMIKIEEEYQFAIQKAILSSAIRQINAYNTVEAARKKNNDSDKKRAENREKIELNAIKRQEKGILDMMSKEKARKDKVVKLSKEQLDVLVKNAREGGRVEREELEKTYNEYKRLWNERVSQESENRKNGESAGVGGSLFGKFKERTAGWFKNAITGWGVGALDATVSFFKNAAKGIHDFSNNMVMLQNITKATDGEIGKMNGTIVQLSKEFGMSAKEGQELLISISRLGASSKNIEKIAVSSASLASAIGGSATEAAELLMQVSNAFGMSEDNIDSLADKVVAYSNTSALSLGRFKVAMGYVAAASEATGVSFDKTAASLAVLVNNGLSASTAGASLRNILSELSSKGTNLEEVVQKLADGNMTYAEASEMVGKRSANALSMIVEKWNEVEEAQKSAFNSFMTAESQASAAIERSWWASTVNNIKSFASGLIAVGSWLTTSSTESTARRDVNEDLNYGGIRPWVAEFLLTKYINEYGLDVSKMSKDEFSEMLKGGFSEYVVKYGSKDRGDILTNVRLEGLKTGDLKVISDESLFKLNEQYDEKNRARVSDEIISKVRKTSNENVLKGGNEVAKEDILRMIEASGVYFTDEQKNDIIRKAGQYDSKGMEITDRNSAKQRINENKRKITKMKQTSNPTAWDMQEIEKLEEENKKLESRFGIESKAYTSIDKKKAGFSDIKSVLTSYSFDSQKRLEVEGAQARYFGIKSQEDAIKYMQQNKEILSDYTEAFSGANLDAYFKEYILPFEKIAEEIRERNLSVVNKEENEGIIDAQIAQSQRLKIEQEYSEIISIINNFTDNTTASLKKTEDAFGKLNKAALKVATAATKLKDNNAISELTNLFIDIDNLKDDIVNSKNGKERSVNRAKMLSVLDSADKANKKTRDTEIARLDDEIAKRENIKNTVGLSKEIYDKAGEEIVSLESKKASEESRYATANRNIIKQRQAVNKEVKTEEQQDIEAYLGFGMEVLSGGIDIYKQVQNQMLEAQRERIEKEIENEKEKNAKIESANKGLLDLGIINQAQYAEMKRKMEEEEYEKTNKLMEKQFNAEKKAQRQQASLDYAMNLAQMAINVAASQAKNGFLGAITTPVLISTFTAIMSAQYATQLAAINKQKYVPKKYEDGGYVTGPSHAAGGVKFSVGGEVMEMEGGEYIVNRRSTAKYRSLIDSINNDTVSLSQSNSAANMEAILEALNKPVRAYIVSADIGKDEKYRTIISDKTSL